MNDLNPAHKTRPSYIRNILQAATNSEMISLAGGLPAESCFPIEKFHEAVSRVLADPSALQYSGTEGEPELRQWLANYLNTESARILITNGAQQAMDLLARSLLQPGDAVVIETPAYLGALQVLDLAQANIIAIDQTATGPDLNQLETAFKQQPKLFYAVPDFHNPTGCCWSALVRCEVVALAEKYQVTIIEDAPYRELRYSGTTLTSLYDLSPEQVCRIGSFSKVAAPGLRLGYLCASKSVVANVSLIKQATDLHSSTLCQRLLLSCLQEPFYRDHLIHLKEDYRRRRNTLVNALRDTLGTKVDFLIPQGGMFLWVTANHYDTDELAERALSKKIAIVPGSVFYPHNSSATMNKMRLNFTHATPQLLIKGVERLATVINAL